MSIVEISQDQAVRIACEHLGGAGVFREEVLAVSEGQPAESGFGLMDVLFDQPVESSCWVVMMRTVHAFPPSPESDIDAIWVDQKTGNVVKSGRA